MSDAKGGMWYDDDGADLPERGDLGKVGKAPISPQLDVPLVRNVSI